MPALRAVRRDAALFLLISTAVFLIHSLSPVGLSGDSRWSVPVILAVLENGSPELSRFNWQLRDQKYVDAQCVLPDFTVLTPPESGCPPGARVYPRFPIATYLLDLPPFMMMDAILQIAPRISFGPEVVRAFLARDYWTGRGAVEIVLASFWIGVAAGFVFLSARRRLAVAPAVALALLFAFATPAWSTASRSLGPHHASIVLLAAALYLLTEAPLSGRNAALAGLVLAYAVWCRPTNALALAALGAFVLYTARRRAVPFALAAALVFAVGFTLSWSTWHTLTPLYFRSQKFGFGATTWIALAGNWISPARGLLIYVPVFACSFAGFWRTRRDPLSLALAALVLVHWVTISLYLDWTAGFSYGPRYFSDLTPVFVYFLIPVLGQYRFWFVLLAMLSFAVHARGAFHIAVHEWNKTPVTINEDPSRAWNWRDPPFLR